jgi:SAM-dependent methyltransferase
MLEQTASHWGQNYFSQSFNRQEWQAHPLSIERQFVIQNRQMREVWFAQKYLGGKPVKRAIGIGVGRAETEVALLQNGAVDFYDLFDVSPVGLDYAKACAEKLGLGERLTCHCMPVGEAVLEDGAYDLVTFVASLHHMQPLDETLKTVRRALKDGGLVWCANEYIGPDRFNYPKTHADIARAFFRQLPPALKNPWHSELPLPSPEEVAAVDPTEAPCSSQIEATVKALFGNLEITSLYGGFAFITFWGLNHDALYETPEGVELVRHILGIDQALSDAGVIPTYFAHLVARKSEINQDAVDRHKVVSDSEDIRPARRIKRVIQSAMSALARRT